MRLSNVVSLYVARLRPRLVQELLAVAGIAVGVGLIFAALVANSSLTGTVRDVTEGVVGKATLQLAATSHEGFDERAIARVLALDGVAAVAPAIDVRANLLGTRGRRSVLLLGGDERLATLGGHSMPGAEAGALASQRVVAIPEGLADELGLTVGQTAGIEIGGRRVEAMLAVPLRASDVGALADSPVVLAPLRYAQEVADMEGRISRLLVRPRDGREDAVASALHALPGTRFAVRPADADVRVFERAASPTNQSTALFSAFSALVGFLFAFSAVLLTVPQRQRLIADLQLAGHPPWVLIEVLVFDALVLGVAGSLLGLALGDRIAGGLFGQPPDYLLAAFAIGEQLRVTWESIAIASGAGLAAALLAVVAPLRQALARHPLMPPAPDRGARRTDGSLMLAGLACLAITVAILAASPRAALVGIVTLTLALLLVLPIALRGATCLFEAATRPWRTPVPTLAVFELRSRRHRSRTLALAATGAVAVLATVAMSGGNADLQRGLQQSAREIDRNADVWVTHTGEGNALATTAFDIAPRTLAAIAGRPAVATVDAYRGGFLDVGDQRAWVLAPPATAPDPLPPSQVLDGDPATASERIRRGGWIALSEAIAARLDATVGDRVTLPTPRPTPLRVAAITTNLAWPPGAIVLNADDHARAWATPTIAGLHVRSARTASPDATARAVRGALPPGTPLRVQTARERTLAHYATARDALERVDQIAALVLACAVLAMAVAMGGMIWQRRPSIARLKVDAFSEGELWSALIVESGLVLGTGCVLGAAFGLCGQALLTRALAAITGFPVIYSPALLSALGVLALVTITAVTMLAVPGWLAVRVAPQPGRSG